MKMQGIISKVYATGHNDWASIRVKLNNGEKVMAVGTIPAPIEGFSVIMDGDYINDIKYGKQFKVKKALVKEKITGDGILSFMSDCINGIGKKKAELIVKQFQTKTIDILLHDPDQLLKISGIGNSNLLKIKKSVRDNQNYLDVFIATNGITTFRQAKKIYEKYKEKTLSILKNDPYTLMYDIDGFGYKKVDKLALSIGIKENSMERICAALYYILDEAQNNEGHCFLTMKEMQERILNLLCPLNDPENNLSKKAKTLYDYLGTAKEELDEIFRQDCSLQNIKLYHWAVKANAITYTIADAVIFGVKDKKLELEEDRLYLYKIYEAEQNVAKTISDFLQSKPTIEITDLDMQINILKTTTDYNKEQLQGIYNGLSSRISIITGGPGRGKTTVIKEISNIWDKQKTAGEVYLCAPTGKAAQRLSESAQKTAYTIHMLNSKIKSGEVILKNNDLVIIDECSMINIYLANKCMNMFYGCSNIIFVGDVDQLASIGPGNFLKDMIKSKSIPVTELLECYRNNGSIVLNSEKVNKGLAVNLLVEDTQFQFINTVKENMIAEIIKQYDTFLNIKDEMGNFCYQMKDIGILTPTNSVSTSGVTKINEALREEFNPYNKQNAFGKWRINDRVMCTKNSYHILTSIGFGVFNGDIGTIQHVHQDNKGEYFYAVNFDDGKRAVIGNKTMDQIMTLAYAITIHKSQGSEYPVVILAINTDHYIMLKRNLLYTAITRAKNKVMLIGSKKAVAKAIQTISDKQRNTTLMQRLQKSI